MVPKSRQALVATQKVPFAHTVASMSRLAKPEVTYRQDLIWRRLTRMFRRFLKKSALSADVYKAIH